MAASQAGTETTTTTTWDFSQALDLVNSLWTAPNTLQDLQRVNKKTTTDTEIVATAATTEAGTQALRRAELSHTSVTNPIHSFNRLQPLGDFTSVFQYLGTAGQSPSAGEDSILQHFANKLDYASDGATYIGIGKALGPPASWANVADTDDGNIATDRSASPPRSGLSKKARWRRNQRIKKGLFKDQHILVSDSEADSVFKRTPARKASVHMLRSGSPSLMYVSNRVPTTDASESTNFGHQPAKPLVSFDPARNQSLQKPLSPIPDEEVPLTPVHDMPSRIRAQAQQQQVAPSTASGEPQASPAMLISSLRFTPASVQPTPTKDPIVSGSPNPSAVRTALRSAQRPKYSIEPMILRSGIDRNWALLLKVIDHFPQDREYLVSPMNMTNHNNHPSGIHIFVDASNIFIGFLDQLKRSRGIPPNYFMQTKIEPSFDALALLIERRRPVAKRVLVGSSPEVPAFQKARSVGYEVCVLEKVFKARELTERQKFFRDRDSGLIDRHAKPPPHGKRPESQGYVSGSDTPTPQYAKEAYVEQGVDEILHLKILESLVDCAAPSTIVLATGDAAMAEYSDGFMAMVERALNKGWNVELYSWSQNISSMYKSTKFLKKWEDQFKIVYLDVFAEELLDM